MPTTAPSAPTRPSCSTLAAIAVAPPTFELPTAALVAAVQAFLAALGHRGCYAVERWEGDGAFLVGSDEGVHTPNTVSPTNPGGAAATGWHLVVSGTDYAWADPNPPADIRFVYHSATVEKHVEVTGWLFLASLIAAHTRPDGSA